MWYRKESLVEREKFPGKYRNIVELIDELGLSAKNWEKFYSKYKPNPRLLPMMFATQSRLNNWLRRLDLPKFNFYVPPSDDGRLQWFTRHFFMIVQEKPIVVQELYGSLYDGAVTHLSHILRIFQLKRNVKSHRIYLILNV